MSETPSENEDIERKLEQLLLDDDGIEEIEAGLGGFNIFEAIGQARREERHSDFLAFLLNPNEAHGLGSEFLSRFLVEVVKRGKREGRPLSLNEFILMDFSGCLVFREHHRIDILCIDESNKFLLAIENKIGSKQGPDQLKRYREALKERYPDYHRVLAFLTPEPESEEPADGDWISVGYREVHSITRRVLNRHKNDICQSVAIAIDHYGRVLRRNIVTDDALAKMARKFYIRHKAALDYVFEQKSDIQQEISHISIELAENDQRISMVTKSKSRIRFVPKAWKDIPAFWTNGEDTWTGSGYNLLFEIQNLKQSCIMCLIIGPNQNQEIRQSIFDYIDKEIPTIGSKPSPNYIHINFRLKPMADSTLLERDIENIEKVKDELEKNFTDFMEKDFSEIVDKLNDRFSNGQTE